MSRSFLQFINLNSFRCFIRNFGNYFAYIYKINKFVKKILLSNYYFYPKLFYYKPVVVSRSVKGMVRRENVERAFFSQQGQIARGYIPKMLNFALKCLKFLNKKTYYGLLHDNFPVQFY